MFDEEHQLLPWTPIVGNGANGTSPHADSRNLAIDKNGNLLEVDDGGIYKMNGADYQYDYNRKWISLNGNLRISEVTSVAWDSKNNALIAGLQDCGSVEQTVSAFSDAEKTWTDARLWTLFGFGIHAVGDGYSLNVDNQHDPPIRYTMLNTLGDMNKREYNEIQPGYVGAPWDHFLFNNGCVIENCALNISDQQDIQNNIAGLIPFELNFLNNKKFVIGAKSIYKFDNRGDDLKIIDTRNTGVRTQCIAYGGIDLREVVYYAKVGDTMLNQQKISDGDWVRKKIPSVRDIAIDIDSADNIFCLTNSDIFDIRNFSTNSLSSQSIIFNLNDILVQKNSWSVISMFKVPVGGVDQRMILVGCQGGVFMLTQFLGRFAWINVGDDLPNTPISEIRYYREDDILVIATLGRGVWVMENFSQKVPKK